MISVLIPIYNHEVVRLVNSVRKQLLQSKINFEIICLDDASSVKFIERNKPLEQIDNVQFIQSEANRGRIKSRQYLKNQAKYDWLLFLDADVKLIDDNFIQNYLSALSKNYEAIFGGFIYSKTPPSNEYLLRWRYGRSKEQVLARERNEKPYKVVISANYIIKKDVFEEVYGNIEYTGYGYDNYFGALLKERQIKVYHIDNPVLHLGIEKSAVYLKKKQEAAKSLIELHKSGKMQTHENNLLSLYSKLHKSGLASVFSQFYASFNDRMKTNLLGKNPSINMLQLYRISYMCYESQSFKAKKQ